LSFHNAQKIHNMLHGVTCASDESQYVLFADDDVFFYPGLIEELLDPLVKEPNHILISTGYEFMIAPEGSNIANYCLLTYRFHNLWSFITDRPILCWGGCWMAPLWVFRKNFNHLVDCYLDGGYSDDTIISCLAQQMGYVCAHPYRAIFPNVLPKRTSFPKYWDFLKRQFFVTDTYSTGYNKRVVHSLAYLIVTTIWLMVIWVGVLPIAGVLAILSYYTSPTFTWTFVATTTVVSIPVWMILVLLFRYASKSLALVANSVRPPDQQVQTDINPFKMYIGLSIHAFLMPIAILVILFSNSIVWAGVRYYKKNGKIYKVERKKEDGTVYSELFASSVARVLCQDGMKKLLSQCNYSNA